MAAAARRRTRELGTRRVIMCVFALFTAVAHASTLPRDEGALRSFKANVSDPANMLASWGAGDPCGGAWAGVTCNGSAPNQYVQRLELANFQLAAPAIPASLQSLQDLEILDLGNNNFSGSTPVWLGNMAKLHILDLQSNSLTGEVPAELGQLQNMTFLRITNNSLSGSLPPALGNLKNMLFFACEDNQLQGPIPASFANLTAICYLHMDHNLFSGPIPDGFGLLPSLLHFVMNNNGLTGPLPSDLGTARSLRQLNLDNNPIGGPLPSSYGNLPAVTDFRLRNCSLTGSIPDASGMTSLQAMDLGVNNLTGLIPGSLGDLGESLVSLRLDANLLDGPIPSSFSGLLELEILDVSNNLLSGEIPSDLGLNPNLLSLRVERNELNGTIPLSLKRATLELVATGNPLCQNSTAHDDPACRSPVGTLAGGAPSPTCPCPATMIHRPFVPPGREAPAGCDCVALLLVELLLPRVLYPRFTESATMQTRLVANMARELYVLEQQVTIDSSSQNGTGTAVAFALSPLAGAAVDDHTVARIRAKLLAPPGNASLWLDGEFGGAAYEVLQFVPPAAPVVPAPSPSPRAGGHRRGGVGPRVWAPAVGAAVLVLLALGGGIALAVWKRWCNPKFWSAADDNSTFGQGLVANGQGGYVSSKSRSPVLSQKLGGPRAGPVVRTFALDELAAAVGNFGPEALIGSGGFGSVYQGELGDGTPVAVKRLSSTSRQGEAEFATEVEMIARQLFSPHLVRLLGYCSQGDERLLVYDLMARGSLLDYLKDGTYTVPLAVLDWRTRVSIAIDASAGLRFLHESDPPVVHRDIKPSNILLDETFNAKVADFGLSKLYPSSLADHVTTRVVGTFGYLAPDYSITGKLTVKSDVYSFGVLLLEILSGRHSTVADENNHEQFLVPWAKPLLKDKKRCCEVVDPAVAGAYPEKGAEMVAALISSCLQLDPDRRPNMNTVNNMLRLALDVPFPNAKAHQQREALMSKRHSFQSTSKVASAAASSSAGGGQYNSRAQFAMTAPTGKSFLFPKTLEADPAARFREGGDVFPKAHRKTVSFEAAERHHESPARMAFPAFPALIHDGVNPR